MTPTSSRRRAAPSLHTRARAARLRRALTREVDRLLDFERIALQVYGFDIERAQGIRQPARGEDRRIHRLGEGPHSIERALDLRSQIFEQAAHHHRVGVEKLACELECNHRRGEILLNAVVQRLLNPTALSVEVGEHMERVGLRVGRGQHDRGRGLARCWGEAEERSVPVEEEASQCPTS